MLVKPSTQRGIVRQLRKRIADLEGELGEQKRIANARINELEGQLQKFKIESNKEQPDEIEPTR